MNIVKPYAKILNHDKYGNNGEFLKSHGMGLLRKIEWCGRISHRSEDLVENNLGCETANEERTLRFIQAVVIGHGDWSIVEHASLSVEFVVDRGITHEIVRHRLFSYTQESTRFVNYEKKMPASFIMPDLNEAQRCSWERNIAEAEMSYKEMISQGCKPQIARSVFPNALASKLVMTGNLRSWRHFLVMRTTVEAHPQMREVTLPLLDAFKRSIPLLYDDIVPNAKQSEQMKLAR
jgi:thymidylate synthase (FAD)